MILWKITSFGKFSRTGRLKGEDLVVHQILLRNGILNLEYVNNLSEVSKPRIALVGLPLSSKDCTSSPSRIVALED